MVIYLGLNTVVAYGCLGLALKYTEANKVSVVITLNPLVTLLTISLLSYAQVSWVSPEHLTYVGYIGAVLIVGGSVIVLRKPKKQKPRAPIHLSPKET